MRLGSLLVVAIVAVAAAGCGNRIEVRSNTYWHGAVRDSDDEPITWTRVEGHGDRTYDGYDCGWAQKDTDEGYLEIKVVRRGFLRPDGEEDRTTEPYAMVQACGSGGGIARER